MNQKNAAQHADDLEMLQGFEETEFVLAREIECVRVDGATQMRDRHMPKYNSCGWSDTA